MKDYQKVLLGFVLGYVVFAFVESMKTTAIADYVTAKLEAEDPIISMFSVSDDLDFIDEDEDD